MSTPAGKIMPAHYSLLYYTKPGKSITFNYEAKTRDELNILNPLDADHYCLRQECINRRKMLGDDDKTELNDIWWNIHRIKHKKYRDQHPCQLPVKLMERIIKLTTSTGDIVFDPFCGAGTTAIAAKMAGRHFVTTDIDEKYVNIARRNIQGMQPTLLGNYYLVRQTQRYTRGSSTKKGVETRYIQLCQKQARVLELGEVAKLDRDLYDRVNGFYRDFKRLKKIAHRRLEILGLLQ